MIQCSNTRCFNEATEEMEYENRYLPFCGICITKVEDVYRAMNRKDPSRLYMPRKRPLQEVTK